MNSSFHNEVRLLRRIVTAALLVLCCFSAGAATAADTNALCVMTYNLRFASATPPNAWPARRPLMSELIRTLAPDVMGTQEGVYGQLQDLASDLSDYEWAGTGRDGGTKGEFMAVFYRKDRLQPLSTNHFWLSDTPEIPASSTWGNSCKRMVTWLRFLDRKTQREFYFFNTHFDHQVQAAREKSAELVRERVSKLTDKLPVILTGDFNATAGENKAYRILTQDNFFRDTWLLARKRLGEEYNTFNGFNEPAKNGIRIDWIFVRGEATVESAETVTFSRDGKFPSDHFPVMTRIVFSE